VRQLVIKVLNNDIISDLRYLPLLLAGEGVLDNVVGVATAYGLDSLRFEFR